MKIELFVSLNLVGCKKKEVIEVDDNLTDDELDGILNDWMGNYIDCGWSKV